MKLPESSSSGARASDLLNRYLRDHREERRKARPALTRTASRPPIAATATPVADDVAAVRPALWRRAAAEFIGTGVLASIVIGAAIAAQQLSEDGGVQLLASSAATALGLAVLIAVLGPVSGAHVNPVITLAEAAHRRCSNDGSTSFAEVMAYLVSQLFGATGGALLAHAMFAEPVAIATTDRITIGTVLGEVIATAGLVLVVNALIRTGRVALIAPVVAAYIGAAYWFTSSSFANPALTVARALSDTVAGIAPSSVPLFIAAQLVGGLLGLLLAVALFPSGEGEQSD